MACEREAETDQEQQLPIAELKAVDRFHPDPHQKKADEANLRALNKAQNINTVFAMVERYR